MKRYKHNKLGWVATKENACYLIDANMGINAVKVIPVELVENSCDWEEIVEKRDYDNVCFEVCQRLYKITKNKKTSIPEYSIEGYANGRIERANWDWNDIDGNFKTKMWKEVPLEQYMAQFKKKLFTTEDGVDIFQREGYYFIDKNMDKIYHQCGTSSTEELSEGHIRFSTKEKAQEYIDMNLPKYSEKDVIKF